MITRQAKTCRRLGPVLMLAVLLGTAAAPVVPAEAQGLTASEAAGSWDLSWEKGNRRCRLSLRAEGTASGHLLAMPAGCRHAFPALAMVAGWVPGDDDHLLFQAASGGTIIDFGPSGGPSLTATVGEENVYDLMPVDPATQAALADRAARPAALPDPFESAGSAAPAAGSGVLVGGAGAPAPGAGTAAATAVAVFPPATAAEVAGHYAVMRQDRDTGCMVTLDAAVNARAEQRAKLAPACRDQGIVIFDPIGWQLAKGDLILTARKGHRTVLTRHSERSWTTTPTKGPPLVLKRL